MITYKTIYDLIYNFRNTSGRGSGNSYHNTDTPGKYFFKLFFYFNQGGLLDTRYNEYEDLNETGPHKKIFYNSALNYLLMNGEYERAELLDKFIHLLSNINTHSPWYFSEIDGLGETISRLQFSDTEMKIDENRYKLIIKCLPDPVDDRIGTLLDLYKAICFSYVQKKEIIPANLRKFTMGIYVFQTPKNIHHSNNIFATIGGKEGFRANSKYFELHNCEILIPSSASAFAALNNKDGIEHNYELGIMFDDVYDERYNAFLCRTIGDFILTDYQYVQNKEVVESVAQSETTNQMLENVYNSPDRSNIEHGPKQTLTEKNIFTETKFGKKVVSTTKNIRTQMDRLADKYSIDSLANTMNDYIIDKLDTTAISLTQQITNITKGNLFYDNLDSGTSITQTLKNGNILGAAESVINSYKDHQSVETTQSGWKKNLFKGG